MPVYQDEDGRGTYYVSLRYKDWRGVLRTHKKRGFTRKRDAKEYEDEFRHKSHRDTEMTFKSLVELYFADSEVRLRDTTMDTKRSMVDKFLLPYLGSIKLIEMNPTVIRGWQNEMLTLRKDGSGEKYADTYLNSINTQLSTILNYGVQYCGMDNNPCENQKNIGKKKAPKMNFWTLDQFNQAMEHEPEWGKRLAFMILYWCGLRIGECLALSPADVLPSKELSITKAKRRKDGLDGPTKTDNSVRRVSMPDFLYDDLMAYIHALYGIQPDDKIFYFGASAVNKELDSVADAAGLPRIRVHDLRHSHAALLAELGYNVDVIADRLGDTVSVAGETYSHLYPDKQAAVAATLSKHRHGFSLKSTPSKEEQLEPQEIPEKDSRGSSPE